MTTATAYELSYRGVRTVTVGSDALPSAGSVLALLDDWSTADCDAVSEHAWSTDAVLLPVRLDGQTALVGPVQFRGGTVCLACAEHARLTASMGRAAGHGERRSGQLPPAAFDVVADIVGQFLQATEAPLHMDTVIALQGSDLQLTNHRARPRHDGCHRCNPLAADSADSVAPPAEHGPPADPGSVRIVNPRTSRERLRASLHDWRFGPVVHVSRSERLSLPIANAQIASRVVDREGGYGRATTFGGAERTALFEALERITGMSPGGRRTALVGSFNDLGPDVALDPARLGRHEPEAEADPRFALTPYSPDVPLSWVWGWSAERAAPLAVPEQAAYWGVRPTGGLHDVLLESSNGCGLGNSPEEAALFGLFETVERDAFLMAWYARTPLRRVAVPADAFVASLADRLEALGYELWLFDATNDLGIPVAVSLALCRDRFSQSPQAFFAAGAHVDPLRAIAAAVVEVVVNVEQAPNVARAEPEYFDRARLRRLFDEPALVTTIGDHVGVNALPEGRDRFDFLLGAQEPQPWQQVWPGLPRPEPDAAELLARLRAQALAAGVDTIVVDQTTPRMRQELGLYAARVVAPGAVPLTFGHLYRRTRGIPRLENSTLSVDPHPFP